MRKVVINMCFGGFGLSHKATMRYAEIKGIKLYPYFSDITKEIYGREAQIGNDTFCHSYLKSPVTAGKSGDHWSDREIERDDPMLIQVVEEMGRGANGRFAELKIVKIPNDVEFTIKEYDGNEWIAEKHRTWA